MEITIGSKVKHIPSGDIVTVEKINPKSYLGSSVLHPFAKVRPLKSDCEIYIEPVKEKSFYEKMRERNIEDANKLPTSPKEIGQHLLWLKAAAIYRIETLDKRTDDKIYTFKQKVGTDDYGKFGFSEHYLNLLMHYAYEAGRNNATESLTRHFNESTKNMKNAIESIVHALDVNDLLPENDNY